MTSSETQISNGERCWQCQAYIFHIRPPGHRMLCVECGQLEIDDECSHRCRLRCPKCRHDWDVWDGDATGIFEEGCHPVTCPSCEHDFEITTSVSYTFTSPEIGDEGEGE